MIRLHFIRVIFYPIFVYRSVSEKGNPLWKVVPFCVYMDTNWIQGRDDVLNRPYLLDFILRERFKTPPAITEKSRNPVNGILGFFYLFYMIKRICL